MNGLAVIFRKKAKDTLRQVKVKNQWQKYMEQRQCSSKRQNESNTGLPTKQEKSQSKLIPKGTKRSPKWVEGLDLEYYAKWNKSDRKTKIAYDFTYMWNLKNKQPTNKNKLIDTEN